MNNKVFKQYHVVLNTIDLPVSHKIRNNVWQQMMLNEQMFTDVISFSVKTFFKW